LSPGHHVRKLLQYVHKRGADLDYHRPEPQSSGKQGDLILTPLELIDLFCDISAALIPPPRIHLHRYYGVLTPKPVGGSTKCSPWVSLEMSAPSPATPSKIQPE
jgi:hypothetical protein